MIKKIVLVSAALLGFNTIAFAGIADGSIYLGAQAGLSQMHYNGSDFTLPSNSVDNNQFGGRLYAGYAFTELLSAELGYGYYGNMEFKHNPDGNKQNMVQQGIDLAGKISLPLDYGFGFYVKAGGAWLHRGGLDNRGGFFVSKDSSSRITALGGLGVTYSINPNWGTEIFWTGTMSNGDLPRMYFYGLGLTYKFVKSADAI